MPGWQQRLAHVTHALLYIAPLSMAASGIGLVALNTVASRITAFTYRISTS
jgi:cytochrome b561